ncbi:MAG: methyltransferase domain-containing protein [Phycisphaeraceae bacterium]|nr:methyltransferase domain-containing protein [Phycisphaeraceae bacterium]
MSTRQIRNMQDTMATTVTALQAPATSAARVERETARLLASSLDKLNFGCGTFPLAGWTNIDNGDGEWYVAPAVDSAKEPVVALDIFEALAALPDRCASCVYSEHVFEHFTLQQGHEILRQWARILRPGGVVRVVTPDLEAEARIYLRQLNPAPDEVIDAHRLRWLDTRYAFQPGEKLTRAMVLNHGMWLDGHKFVYDFETIGQSLRLAGFDSVVRARFGESRHAELRGIDKHDGGETGRAWIPSIALVVEATRPQRLETVAAPSAAPPAPPSALERAMAELGSLRAHHGDLAARAEQIRRRLIESVAERCAASGWRRIALYGAGRHTEPIICQPWNSCNVRVVAVIDDTPKVSTLRGVPVYRPQALPLDDVDAVVISSDAFEQAIFDRAHAWLTPRRIPVVRIYGTDLARNDKAARG